MKLLGVMVPQSHLAACHAWLLVLVLVMTRCYNAEVVPSISPTYYPTLSPHSISIITTIAGTGTASYSGDGGQATAATFNNPRGIDFDSSGNIYFAECSNHRVRKITVSTGIISTYVGTGSGVYSGDGVVASSATLKAPIGLCLDTAGTNQYMQPVCFVQHLTLTTTI